MFTKLYGIFLGNVFFAVLYMIWLYFGPSVLTDIFSLNAELSGILYFMMIFVCLLLAIFANIAHYRKKHKGTLKARLYYPAALSPYLLASISYINNLIRLFGSH